jgi:hypothetical protein
VTMTLKIDGMPATVRALEELPRNIQKLAIGKALRAGTAPTIKAARRLAPRATGLLKRSIVAKFKSYRGGAVQIEIIGQGSEVKNRKKLKAGRGGISGRGDIVPVHLVEEDTKPHGIPKTVRLKQIKTSKEWRDAQRAQGLAPRKYAQIRRLYKPLAIQAGGGVIYRGSARHPGTQGSHFLREASESTMGQTTQRFSEKLKTEVEAAVGTV